MNLQAMGVEVKYHHHEVGGPGQCEIEIPLLPPLAAAEVRVQGLRERVWSTSKPGRATD